MTFLRFHRRKILLIPLAGVKTRNAMEICIFAVLWVSTIRTALGLVQLPASLHHSGLPWGQIAASILNVGCIIALVGLAWPNRDDGLLTEQVGLVCTCFGLIFYAGAVYNLSGFNTGVFAIAMSLGIALACVVRYVQIQHYVHLRKAANNASAE